MTRRARLVDELMEDAGMSQTELAARIGLNHSTVSDYLRGKYRASSKNLKLMALALRYEGDPSDLFKEV